MTAEASTRVDQLDLSFGVRNGQTVLERRLFSYPYVIMRTFRHGVQEDARLRDCGSLSVVVQNSSGPVHDRDALATSLRLEAGTAARVVYQGATAVHRARDGNVSGERLLISLGENTRLTYLPAPRIFFPDAAHRQRTDIELSQASTLFYTDSFTVHDPSCAGRPLRELDNTLTVRRGSELLLLDRQHLRTPRFERGFQAFGTILLLGHPAPVLPEMPGLYAAVSELPSALGWTIRLAAPDLRPLRALIESLSDRQI